MKSLQSLVVDTRKMYNNLCEASFDMVSDGSNPNCVEENVDVLTSLAQGDMDGIRQAFKDGMTPFLVPDLIQAMDDDEVENELRVWHLGGLIGVVINKEIMF